MKLRILLAGALALLLDGCTSPGTSTGDRAQADPSLYDTMSDRNVALAAALLQDALETAPDGTTRAWVDQTTGDRGWITPIRSYLSEGGYFCRDYREELAVGGQVGRFEHAACRDPAGRWIWL